ncbi:cell wall hydrolase [Aquibacillus salsiterrae]|uniref:Cell wall hydrolase n=1 Tax=Aquibacillus salsiterrae TaxID=2950439 RepID=A0A9X3WDT5_9BACI|nr:cell wall hydrolase [Aquibacillus salsiterrae]MDC3417178.1 cell wall hydrolase [Aquibacillus salsiterrae]
MKKFKNILLATTLTISAFLVPTNISAASSYTVQNGDSLWKISNTFGIPITSIKESNNQSGNMIYIGQRLTIPTTVSTSDKQLLAQLVEAEAKGEPYAGKVAVATVVLNRVDHSEFPNTVKGVIYQKVSGYYAFTPVQNGAINNTPTASSIRAVNEALAFRGQGQGSIYFYNPKTSTSDWINSRQTTVTIGNHRFAK